MSSTPNYPGTLQENLLTTLCHSDEHGRVVAAMVDPALFEGDYRVVAERAVEYWRRYRQAPKAHTADLLSDILDAKKDRRAPTFRNILVEMLRLSEEINAPHVLERLRTFTRAQRFKALVLRSAERLEALDEVALPEIEEMWGDLLRAREETFARGSSLNDTGKLIDFVRTQSVEFSTGIEELDRRGIAPMRGSVMFIIAPTGVGKSWAFIHLAKRAIMQRKKVLYITLEMSEAEVLMRFYQSFFSVTDRALRDPLIVSQLEKDSLGKLSNILREEIKPEFSFDSANLEDELETRRRLMEGKFRNIEIKKFPMRGLTIPMLRGYMDSLEYAGFVPDVLILDYIGIMKTNASDASDFRISLSSTFGDFCGICDERNIAGITAQQINREGSKRKRSTQTDVAEAWALAGDAHMTISLSATEAERRYGLLRLFVEKSRRSRDKFGVLLTQNYDTGQFVLESVAFDEKRYADLFDAEADNSDDGEE